MTTPLSALALLVSETADSIFDGLLDVARVLGLPVDSWRVGDPTRTQFRALSEMTATRDAVQTELAKSAFLDTAEREWLKARALDVYNVEAEEATFAAPSVVLVNAGGGLYEIDVGGLIVSSTATGGTFQNQEPFTIDPLSTTDPVLLIAQTAGSAGSVAIDDIDTIVSPTLTGVTIGSSTAALGADEQSEPGIREQCRATLGALSPDGPADAYEYVARNAELTGIDGITRASAAGDSSDGTVTVYVATDTAGVDGATVTAIQAAVDEWAQPLCTDATVASASPQTFAVTLTGVDVSEQDFVEQTLDTFFISVDLGGLVARDAITSAVRVALADASRPVAGAIGISLPASDTTLGASRFPVRGTLILS